MQEGSVISIITNHGRDKGIITDVETTEESISYSGYIDGRHSFEIVYVKKSQHYSGSVHWDNRMAKNLSYNASFIDSFSEPA